jgi:hypothetical protein
MKTPCLCAIALLTTVAWPGHLLAQHVTCVNEKREEVPCGGSSNEGHRNRSPSPPDTSSAPTTDSNDDADAERQRIEEQQHQKQKEEQLRREAEEKARKQKEWENQKAEALKSLKGVPSESPTIKGGNTASFGLKGTSAADAALAIKTNPPDHSDRQVSKAWQQIHCAAELAQYALDKAHQMESATGDTRPLEDEIRYLAQEASNALHGNPVGVQCSPATPMKFRKTPDPAQLAPVYDRLFTRVLDDAQKLNRIRSQKEEAQKQMGEARRHLADLKIQKPPAPVAKSSSPASSAGTADDERIRKAAAEQKQYQEEQQKKVNEVYAEQKKDQQKQFDFAALVRKTQAEINMINSTKYGTERDLKSVEDQIKANLSGDIPAPQ